MNSTANFAMIAALDLDPIKNKLMQKESGEGWTLEQANAVEFEYRRFLYLTKLFPREPTAPTMDVDIFWHYHILDTMKYAADCDQVFGYFLHHVPDSGSRGHDDEAVRDQNGARMHELYEATFGESYVRQTEGHALMARPPLAPADTAWCVPTKGNPISAKAAWCVPTQENPPSAKAAWCVPTQENPTSAKAAWCVPTQKNTTSAKAAWCVPAEGNPASPQPAAASTAWCVPTQTNPGPSRPISANAAWCVPTQGDRASSPSALAKTAWCVPTQRSPARLPGSTATTARPRAVAQNNSFFSPAVLAEAA